VSLRSSWGRRDAYNCPPLVPAIVFPRRRFWHLRRFSPISVSAFFPVPFLEPRNAFQHPGVWVRKRVLSPGLLEALLAYFGADIQNKLNTQRQKTGILTWITSRFKSVSHLDRGSNVRVTTSLSTSGREPRMSWCWSYTTRLDKRLNAVNEPSVIGNCECVSGQTFIFSGATH
jgi:hypothetical protein